MNPGKAIAVARKEFRQISRDRRSLLVLLFVPAFFLLLYGYALNFDVQHIHLALEDDDQTPASRSVVNIRRVGTGWKVTSLGGTDVRALP